MKYGELNNKSRDELNSLLIDLKEKLLKMNFDLADNKLHDVSQIKKIKKDVARIYTMLKKIS